MRLAARQLTEVTFSRRKDSLPQGDDNLRPRPAYRSDLPVGPAPRRSGQPDLAFSRTELTARRLSGCDPGVERQLSGSEDQDNQ